MSNQIHGMKIKEQAVSWNVWTAAKCS